MNVLSSVIWELPVWSAVIIIILIILGSLLALVLILFFGTLIFFRIYDEIEWHIEQKKKRRNRNK